MLHHIVFICAITRRTHSFVHLLCAACQWQLFLLYVLCCFPKCVHTVASTESSPKPGMLRSEGLYDEDEDVLSYPSALL